VQRLAKIIQINAPLDQVYQTWRRVEDFPRCFDSIRSVERRPDGATDWVARAWLGRSVRWQAMVTEDLPETRIRWQSIGGEIALRGLAEFIPAEGGTVMLLVFEYRPPLGLIGRLAAWAVGLEGRLERDLTRFKQQVEVGRALAPEPRWHFLPLHRDRKKALVPSTVSNAT
jgi:uncharacterized membrane protein